PGFPAQAPSVWMMTVSAMDRPPVDMELAGKAARLGFDMGLFHADPFEDREGSGVAGVGEADEVLAFAAPEEPVAQPRRRFRRIARPVKILEQGVAYFRFAGGGINPEAGAADKGAVALAGQAQFAQLPAFEQIDPGAKCRFGLRPRPGRAARGQVAGNIGIAMQGDQVVELVQPPARQNEPLRLEEVES